MTDTELPVHEVIGVARELAKAGRWPRAASLLDAAAATDARSRALIALAAAEVALESDWFAGTRLAAARLSTAEAACAAADLDPAGRWDLAFMRLRRAYFDQLFAENAVAFGPDGKDPAAIAALRREADDLRVAAPDGVRRGWAEMYLGLIADNVAGERDAAPAHYAAALRASESEDDDLLAREALRHLGEHDHDRGDHRLALERWSRATALGARAGAVVGTLSQQTLLAVLARDTGDEAGAVALAHEIVRWAGALGAVRIEAQATGFLAGVDPTAPPDHGS
jgi:tetratricopeptide (TPR) repeat protein